MADWMDSYPFLILTCNTNRGDSLVLSFFIVVRVQQPTIIGTPYQPLFSPKLRKRWRLLSSIFEYILSHRFDFNSIHRMLQNGERIFKTTIVRNTEIFFTRFPLQLLAGGHKKTPTSTSLLFLLLICPNTTGLGSDWEFHASSSQLTNDLPTSFNFSEARMCSRRAFLKLLP